MPVITRMAVAAKSDGHYFSAQRACEFRLPMLRVSARNGNPDGQPLVAPACCAVDQPVHVGMLDWRRHEINHQALRCASASATRLEISSAGDVTPGATDAQHMGTSSRRWSAVYSNYTETKTSIRIGDAGSNAGADLQFKGAASGAGGGRSWRFGNALNSGADVFEISASDSLGGTDWRTAIAAPNTLSPVMAFNGGTNAVAINTTAFSGTDNSDPANPVNRDYILNVEGDVNFNGQLFQDNEEFVTSRWT